MLAVRCARSAKTIELTRYADRGDIQSLASNLDWAAKFMLLCRNKGLSLELALLNQNYHEFTDANSVFYQLDAGGMLDHRVGETIPAGGELDPFIPNTTTRAAARARFIRDRAGSADATITWSYAVGQDGVWTLDDPFAKEFFADKSVRRNRRGRPRDSVRQTLYVEDLLRRSEEF